MTEAEAAAEAERRNLELGVQGVEAGFWIEIEGADGKWQVELRQDQPKTSGRLGRIIDALLSGPWP